MLIDVGNGQDLEFGHYDYYTGEGRFITHSENGRERYINPELTYDQRNRISNLDSQRRNRYEVSLLCVNNVAIRASIYYNHATDDLSLSWRITGYHGKKVGRLN